MISGHVFSGDNPSITKLKQKLKIVKSRQLQSLVFSFPRINDNADDQTKKTKSSKSYSKKQWQFFEKITGESDSQNGFTQISNNFGDEFTGVFINSNHRRKTNTGIERCQTGFLLAFSKFLEKACIDFLNVFSREKVNDVWRKILEACRRW